MWYEFKTYCPWSWTPESHENAQEKSYFPVSINSQAHDAAIKVALNEKKFESLQYKSFYTGQ